VDEETGRKPASAAKPAKFVLGKTKKTKLKEFLQNLVFDSISCSETANCMSKNL
jgi:hypothetical protein